MMRYKYKIEPETAEAQSLKCNSDFNDPYSFKQLTQFQILYRKLKICISRGFPGGAGVKNPPANAGDTGSSPGLGRSHMPRSN